MKKKPDKTARQQPGQRSDQNSSGIEGDKNYVLQGNTGNITINNGVPPEQLKSLLAQAGSNAVKELLAAIRPRQDEDAKQLSGKIEQYVADNTKETGILKDKLDLLLQQLSALERDRILAYDTLKKFSLDQETKRVNREIDETKKRLAELS
ncbi:MAG: hypothetical protein INR73_11575 [Williamsia sp.]|nr:hypothetical protein [Williamsia sp.]